MRVPTHFGKNQALVQLLQDEAQKDFTHNLILGEDLLEIPV